MQFNIQKKKQKKLFENSKFLLQNNFFQKKY